jgi:hypothetical protein
LFEQHGEDKILDPTVTWYQSRITRLLNKHHMHLQLTTPAHDLTQAEINANGSLNKEVCLFVTVAATAQGCKFRLLAAGYSARHSLMKEKLPSRHGEGKNFTREFSGIHENDCSGLWSCMI